jgi:DNA-binding MarR family transcriptional regulator
LHENYHLFFTYLFLQIKNWNFSIKKAKYALKPNILPIKKQNMLDETDIRILMLLQQNAKLTIKELSEELNLTTSPVFERIKRLEKGRNYQWLCSISQS